LASIWPTAISASRVACLALALCLVGCATQREQSTDAPRDEQQRLLTTIERWSFSGRVAVKTEAGADSARLTWRQQADDLEMTLSGPVGVKRTTLIREDNVLSLLHEGKRELLSADDDPLRREFGWSLPLDYLPWWLRGLPAPSPNPGRSQLEAGRLTLLEQAGWTLEFPEYQWVDGHQLPRTIRFQREGVEGKILLKNWVLEL
jgi:outer membrane lipoprotein LolB